MDTQDQNKKLFSEFPPVSTPQWEEKIIADLKGADYEKKLIWKSDEGINVKPYYRAEDINNLNYLSSLPGESPFVRGLKQMNNNWIIRQDIFTEDIAEANRIAVEAVSKGADAIGLDVKSVTTHKQIQQLLHGINITSTGINFISSRSYPLTLELFVYEIAHRGLEGKKITGSLNFDAISYLLLHGDFYQSKQGNFDEAEYLINTVGKKIPGFRCLTVNGQHFRNAGAKIIQELAFSLASANEYLAELTTKGLSADSVAQNLVFSFGVGSDYFMEIAKLRAARLLWTKILEQYKPGNEESAKMFIHSVTSLWNKTIFDPYVNVLRTTTEGMSAILGNTDSMSILPFDLPYKDESEFSRRIARNQQLILKEESYLDKIVDPAAGSYYIESLTNALAQNAWDLFKVVEEKGGIIECIKSGFIQDEIERSCRKKDMDIAQRKIVILGTNQYANPNESVSADIEKNSAPVIDTKPAYRKLNLYRGAMAFEKIRLATEHAVNNGRMKPAVFLLTIGNPVMRKARATFSSNFFGCAGYKIIDNPGFKTPEDGANEALKSGAGIIVVCSSDDEYLSFVPGICKIIKKENNKAMVIVAGYPKEIINELQSNGVDDFIHLKTNVLDFLKQTQEKLGIK